MPVRRSGLRFRSILCPVDFSAPSADALRYAAALSRRVDARLTVLFVNDPLLVAAARRAYGRRRQVVDQSLAELSQFVADAAGHPPKPVELLVSVGNPADEILRAASRLHSDVILLGTRGLSGLARFFFGTTTEQVLARATIPVLAMPARGRRRIATRPFAVDRIVCPIDLAGAWESDAIRAAGIARVFGVELLLVHVVRPARVPPWLRQAGSRGERGRMQNARAALERVAARLPGGIKATAAVVSGDPAHRIARLTRSGSPLVVMSLRGPAGVWGRRGSIAYHVLTHASTPVLALPRRRLGGPLPARLRHALAETLSARDRVEIAGIDALLSIGAGRVR